MCKVVEVAAFAIFLMASLVAAPVGGSLVAYYNFDGTDLVFSLLFCLIFGWVSPRSSLC